MITSNVIQRVFHLRMQPEGGSFTGFTLDINGRQYLCTAKHCLKGVEHPENLYAYHEEEWKVFGVKLVDWGSNDADICVLAPDIRLSPPLPLSVASTTTYGQEVYFLGFPYGMQFDTDINNGFPVPFVKRATLSAYSKFPNGQNILYLDGHNNLGFSGAPVVFVKKNNKESQFHVASIVSSYIPEPNKPNKMNAGIIVTQCISHAVDAIKRNSIGYELAKGSWPTS